MKRKGLVKSIVSASFAVLAFISLAFNFGVLSYKAGNTSETKGFSLSDWFELLKGDSEKLACYKVAQVLMIILLVVIVAVAALAIVQVFVDKKVLKLCLKIASIAGIVLSVAFMLTFFIGGAVLSSSTTIFGYTVSQNYFPNAGSMMLGLFALVSSCLGLQLVTKSKKEKKSK